MKDIIINADDYAMDAGVDAAILELGSKGVVTAASAMVLPRRWEEAARALRDAPRLSIGLHLDLTSPFADWPFSGEKLPALMVRAGMGMLGRETLRRTVDRQLSLFDTAMHAPPVFVDGHQHVHQLPVVRDVLIEALSANYGSGVSIGLRICASRRWRGVKAEIISRAGAVRLAALADRRAHQSNTDFAGVYNFAPDTGLPSLWESWLAGLRGPLPLVMCHPAKPSNDSPPWDGIRQARYREFEWLASDDYRSMLQRYALRPVRWPSA